MGNPTEAIEYFEDVLRMNPNNIDALVSRGASYHYLGNHKKAKELFEEILKDFPEDKDAPHYLGVAQAVLGEKEIGLKNIELSLTRNPGNGLAWTEKGKRDGGLSDRKIINQLYCRTGKILVELGRYEEALKSFSTAEEKFPTLRALQINRGTKRVEISIGI